MADNNFDLQATLEALGVDAYASQFQALGIRSLADFHYVEDSDLVQWGLTTIQRRKFFRWRNESTVEGLSLISKAGAVPPCKHSIQRPHQGSPAADSASHATLLSAAERVLAINGPQPLELLRERLQRLDNGAMGLHSMSDDALSEALEAIANITHTPAAGDQEVIVALRLHVGGEVIFILEPVVLRLGDFLALRPEELLRVGVSCKAAHASGLAQSSDVWLKLLWLWHPKASLEDPEDVERAREARASADCRRAHLIRHLRAAIGTDEPVTFTEILQATNGERPSGDVSIDARLTPSELLQMLARHPEVFKQQQGSPDVGAMLFCIEPKSTTEAWEPVNPYQDVRLLMASNAIGKPEAPEQEQVQQAGAAPSMTVSRLDPKSAFRLFHTGLLTANVSQERSQKGGYGRTRGTALRSWEYLTESNMRAVRPSGELLDAGDQGVKAIRQSDPKCVHTLVLERLDGVVYHVAGCFNRRVQLLTAALQGGQLLIDREKRKQFERKLLEFMENVRKERAFGFFFCPRCNSRWRSGFTYEEIGQECLKCGVAVKPFRITELQSKGLWPGMRTGDGTRTDDIRDEARAAGREHLQRLELPLAGKNANEGATFFAKVEQDLLILADKFVFKEARIARSHGRISWQVELSGVCSKEAWAEAQAELQDLLAYHGLHATQEAFVDRHERQMAEHGDMQEIRKRAEAANSWSTNGQRKAKAANSSSGTSKWQEHGWNGWHGHTQSGAWWKDAWCNGNDGWTTWKDGASWREAWSSKNSLTVDWCPRGAPRARPLAGLARSLQSVSQGAPLHFAFGFYDSTAIGRVAWQHPNIGLF